MNNIISIHLVIMQLNAIILLHCMNESLSLKMIYYLSDCSYGQASVTVRL